MKKNITNKPSNIWPYILSITIFTLFIIGLAGFPVAGSATSGQTTTLDGTQVARAHLPIIRYDASPTPVPTPTPVPVAHAATLQITPFKAINGSTFETGAFVLRNESLNGAQLTELRIDLTTAIFPDMVFDPYGTAGDTIAKDLTPDAQIAMTLSSHRYESPHASGYDVLVMNFSNFNPGGRFEFSVDVDPTSIRGTSAPGPGESGSVGGLELVGATITATFNDGEVLVGQVWRMDDRGPQGPNHSGAVADLRAGLPPRPQLEAPGLNPPVEVTDTVRTIRVSGPAGQPVTVLVVEGALFIEGVPGGGFDIDPFEANNALTTREYAAYVGPGGTVEIPVALSRSRPEGGINIITAAFDNFYGVKGLVAGPIVLELIQ